MSTRPDRRRISLGAWPQGGNAPQHRRPTRWLIIPGASSAGLATLAAVIVVWMALSPTVVAGTRQHFLLNVCVMIPNTRQFQLTAKWSSFYTAQPGQAIRTTPRVSSACGYIPWFRTLPLNGGVTVAPPWLDGR